MTRIGPYHVVAELARGTLGVSYLARRDAERDARWFVVTHFHDAWSRDRNFLAGLDDARAGLGREHPHLIGGELGRFEWGYYLAAPYFEGATLGELLARNPERRPAAPIVRIILDALAGLAAAASGDPIFHLHLDPDRLLVGSDGVTRVRELGMARARALVASGLSPYCAPRRRGQAHDARSDVFALGAVMWSALTGRALFRGGDDHATRKRLLELDVAPPSAVGLKPPPQLDAVILRALDREPSARFASTSEFAAALTEAASPGGLVGDPADVAQWVTATFEQQFVAHRDAIAASSTLRDVVMIPPLGSHREPVTDRWQTVDTRYLIALLGAACAGGGLVGLVG